MKIEDEKAFDAEIEKMEAYLSDESVSEEACELIPRLSVINAYMARSGRMLAQAKYAQEKAMAEAFKEFQEYIMNVSPSIATKFVQSICHEENLRVNRLDRINRDCVHQSDNIRTQISFSKMQLQLERQGY